MNCPGDLEQLDSPLFELCAVSENQKTFHGVLQWNISNREIKKHLTAVGNPTSSKTFSVGSPTYCSFHFLFHIQKCDNESDSLFLKSLAVSIIFNSKLPSSAWIKGKIHFEELDAHETFSVRGNSFQKRYDITIIPCNLSDFDKLFAICQNGLGVSMHCSLKIITREVECVYDKKSTCYAESRNYDSAKETFKHGFSDVSISIGDHLIMTYKTLLAQIPYFQELFDANKSEKHFELTDIDYEVFNHVISYLYSGDIPMMPFKLACELYIVAGDLKISELKNLCSSHLGANLTDTNVLIVLKLSHEYEDSALKKECFKFLKRSDAKMLTEKTILL